MMPAPPICPLTGLNTENFESAWDGIEYIIKVNSKKILIRIHNNDVNSKFFETNKHLFTGIILNNKLPKEFYNINSPLLDNVLLETIIRNSGIPSNPTEKILNLLIYIHSLQAYEGSPVSFPDENPQYTANKLYFKNIKEMVFYLFTLKKLGLIEGRDSTSKEGMNMIGISLTYDGLAKVIEANDQPIQSKKCFIAMSFSENMKETRQTIKSTVISLGYQPILIDEIHYESHLTINDVLIAEIKKCKFMIADFTDHKHGVYFESGFALGLKRPVIYLCNKVNFADTHFDTNHYPHIIYSNLIELNEKLKAKIEAWIS